MKRGKTRLFILACVATLLASTSTVRAHVVLAEPQAAPGARYIAHFKVGHGCDGSPTVALTVTLPPAVIAVMPEAPAGWKVSTVRDNGRITSVTWKGGVIAADKPGLFAVAMTLPASEGTLAFPALQTCESGEERWVEIGVEDSKRPAPVLHVAKDEGGASTLVVSDGWFRTLPASAPSAAYFTLRNTGTAAVTLTGADSPACGTLMIHRSEDKAGVSAMRDMATVAVAPGAQVQFAPGGFHLMCMDAKPMLKVGGEVTVRLLFQNAAPVTAKFVVRNAAGR